MLDNANMAAIIPVELISWFQTEVLLMAICRTCKGSGEYKSGLHSVICPAGCDEGEVDSPACYECEFAIPDGVQYLFQCKQFCSQKCMDNYEANGYLEGEEDYYCGEREVDSDPYS
jgi:hypothetical protein